MFQIVVVETGVLVTLLLGVSRRNGVGVVGYKAGPILTEIYLDSRKAVSVERSPFDPGQQKS